MSRNATILESSRREARFVVGVWLACCAYVVGYAGLYAYRVEPEPRLILGMPAWVFWGIVVPWLACFAATSWFALRGIRDEDLGEEQEHGEGAGV